MSDLPAAGPATIKDLARVSGIHRVRLAAAVEQGEPIPLRKIGGRWYSRWEWINRWIETGTWNPEQIERPATVTRADEI